MTLLLTKSACQIAVVRPLADELYACSRGTSLINQTQNELGLLLSVLSTAETQSGLLQQTKPNHEFEKTLESCYSTLLELQRLQQLNGDGGIQDQINEIRAKFSDLIFELSVMNADTMISSQARLNSQLQDYIADVKAGKRDATIVEETLQTADFPEQDIAWTNLQRELQDVGIAPKLSTLDRESIISFLRKAAQEHDLLKTVDSKQSKSEDTPAPTIISEPGMNTSQLQPVRSSPNGPSRDNRISSKEVLPAEDFPIPVVSDLQDVDDSSKHAVPREDFPIPVALEPLIPQDDFDKQVMPADIHVPIPTDTATTSRSQHETASTPRPRSTPPLIARGKKPSLMSRMKYRMSNNKGEFIKLVKMGGLYSIKYALDQGANVNSTDRKGHTALVAAVSLCLEDVVSLLLEYGAKVNEVGSYGESALGVAASKGYDDLVQLLLVSGAEPDAAQSTRKLALCEAANCGSMTISKMLLDWGADVNAVDLTGKTALSYAASHGHSQIVQLLLENEAEVDKASRAGQTPLFQAVSIGNARCVELLLIFSADPHEPDVNGLSPMALAAQLGGTEVLRIFSDFGFGFRYYVM